LEPLGPSLLATCTGFFILSMLALRLTLHSSVDDVPELLRWRNRRFTVFLVLALMDLLAAGLSWIAPIAGYLAVAAVVGYVLVASHLANLKPRPL
jgi:predicted Na+-dependent transporter